MILIVKQCQRMLLNKNLERLQISHLQYVDYTAMHSGWMTQTGSTVSVYAPSTSTLNVGLCLTFSRFNLNMRAERRLQTQLRLQLNMRRKKKRMDEEKELDRKAGICKFMREMLLQRALLSIKSIRIKKTYFHVYQKSVLHYIIIKIKLYFYHFTHPSIHH